VVVLSRKCGASIRSDQVISSVDMKLIVGVYDILIRSITAYELREVRKAGRCPTEESACEHIYLLVVLILVGIRSR